MTLKNLLTRPRSVFLIILLLCVIGYAPSMGSPFKMMDDGFSIVENDRIRSLSNIPGFFTTSYFSQKADYFRPLVYVSYTIEYQLFKLQYFFYNLDNVLLHAFNAWLVFILTGLLLARRSEQGAGLLPAVTALLYAIHPVQWEAVTNVSGRSIILAATFVFTGFICLIRYFRSGTMMWLAGAVASYALALMSKESAGVLILTGGLYAALVEKGKSEKVKGELSSDSPPFTLHPSPSFWQRFITAGSLFLCVAVVYLVYRKSMGMTALYPWENASQLVIAVVTFLKGLWIYLSAIVIPVGLYFDRGLTLLPGMNAEFWLILASWVIVTTALWRFRRGLSPLTIFLIIWFLLELLPVSQIVTSIGVFPGAISLADHFLYVALAPGLLLLVIGAERLASIVRERRWAGSRTLCFAGLGYAVFLFVMLLQQTFLASSEFTMVRESLRRDPRNARLEYSMGLIFVKTGDTSRALEHVQKAAAIEPANVRYRMGLGKALVDNGKVLDGISVYESIVPDTDFNRNLLKENAAAAYRQMAKLYRDKLAVNSNDASLHFGLGVFQWKLGKIVAASQSFRKALTLDPSHKDARANLAVCYEAMGRPEKARQVREHK